MFTHLDQTHMHINQCMSHFKEMFIIQLLNIPENAGFGISNWTLFCMELSPLSVSFSSFTFTFCFCGLLLVYRASESEHLVSLLLVPVLSVLLVSLNALLTFCSFSLHVCSIFLEPLNFCGLKSQQ